MFKNLNLSKLVLPVVIVGLVGEGLLFANEKHNDVSSQKDSIESPIDEIAIKNDAKGQAVFMEFKKMLKGKKSPGELYDYLETNHQFLDEKSRDYLVVQIYRNVDKETDKYIRGIQIDQASSSANHMPLDGKTDEYIKKLGAALNKEFATNFKGEDTLRYIKHISKAWSEYLNISNMQKNYSDLRRIEESAKLENILKNYPNFILIDEVKSKLNNNKRELFSSFTGEFSFDYSRLVDKKVKGKTEKIDVIQTKIKLLAEDETEEKEFINNYKDTEIWKLCSEYFSILENFKKKNGYYIEPILMDEIEEFFNMKVPELDLYGKKSIELVKINNTKENDSSYVVSKRKLNIINFKNYNYEDTPGHVNEITQYKNSKIEKKFYVNNDNSEVKLKAEKFLNQNEIDEYLKQISDSLIVQSPEFEESVKQGKAIFWERKKWIDEVNEKKNFKGQFDFRIESWRNHGFADSGWVIQQKVRQKFAVGIDEVGYDDSGNIVIFSGTGEIRLNKNGNLVCINSERGFGDNSIINNYDHNGGIEYQRISDDPADLFYNKVVKGKYISNDGKAYSFDENFMANLNGEKFKLAISPGDYYYINTFTIHNVDAKYNLSYDGIFKDNKLYIYKRNHSAMHDIRSANPLFILTKIK